MAAVIDHIGAPALSRLAVPAQATLPDDIRKLIDEQGGDNWIRALSLNPETARRFVQYFGSLFGASGQQLALAERESVP